MYQQLFALHAQLLKALAHPKRLEIIHLLRHQELCVSDIHSMLDLPQANVSQHLMILRDAGVVATKKNGKQIFYHLSHPNIIKASDQLREVLIEQGSEGAMGFQLLGMRDLFPLVHDPVCQMRLSPKTAGFTHDYLTQTYYFCASGCLKIFKKDPKKYVDR
jgi:DNA-binding transcriptional ArsR family regulator/YHS domain-containing protein